MSIPVAPPVKTEVAPLNPEDIIRNETYLLEPEAQHLYDLDPEAAMDVSTDKVVVRYEQEKEVECRPLTVAPALDKTKFTIDFKPEGELVITPDTTTLLLHYQVDDFWCFPRYGIQGFLESIRVNSGKGKGAKHEIEPSQDRYDWVMEFLKTRHMSNAQKRQHVEPMECANWTMPQQESLNIAYTAADREIAILYGDKTPFSPRDVGGVIAVQFAATWVFCRIETVSADGTTLTVNQNGMNQLPNHIHAPGALPVADVAAAAKQVRFFPALDSEIAATPWGEAAPKTSVTCAQRQERAMMYDVNDRPATMRHQFYGIEYLSGKQRMYPMLTGGLSFEIHLNPASAGLWTLPGWGNADKTRYRITAARLQYYEQVLFADKFGEIDSILQAQALSSVGKVKRLTTHLVTQPVELKANQKKYSVSWDRAVQSLDSLTLIAHPRDNYDDMTLNTYQQLLLDAESLTFKHSNITDSYDDTELSGHAEHQFARAYKQDEISPSAGVDNFNFEEFKEKPFLTQNLQHGSQSNRHTGVQVLQGQDVSVNMKFEVGKAPSVAWQARLLGSYTYRIHIGHDGNDYTMMNTLE